MTGLPSSRLILPDAEFLRQVFRYDEETGFLYYLDRPDETFTSRRAANSWRANFCGEMAGCVIKYDGREYVQIQLYGKKYVAHRIIWKMYYGSEPPEIIDHADGNGTNNKIDNIRAATIFQNGWNVKKSSRNKSGYKGVSFNKERNRWRAAIRVNKKDILIGYYSSAKEASEAYQKASAKHHGEFYNPT